MIVLIITLQIDHFSSKGTLGNGYIHESFKELPAFIVREGLFILSSLVITSNSDSIQL